MARAGLSVIYVRIKLANCVAITKMAAQIISAKLVFLAILTHIPVLFQMVKFAFMVPIVIHVLFGAL